MCSQLARFSTRTMAKNIVPPNRAVHWILDWDGTLTKRDTLDALVNIAHDHKPAANVPETWKGLTQAYLSDYDASMKTLCPDGKRPSTVLQERELLRRLRDVEERSIDRVSKSAIFRGLTPEVVKSGAEEAMKSGSVQLRTGCQEFLQYLRERIQKFQTDDLDIIDILSVNWSQRFIAGCLKASMSSLPDHDIGTPDSEICQMLERRKHGPTKNERILDLLTFTGGSGQSLIKIYSNELQGLSVGDESSGSLTSQYSNKLIASADKLNYLQRLRRHNPYTMKPIPVIYVGDSWTDFECLLAAELGVCIRDDPMTSSQREIRDCLERLGIKCPHIQNAEGVDECSVVWASDFAEIQSWFQECQPTLDGAKLSS